MELLKSKTLFICLLVLLSACGFNSHYAIKAKFDNAEGLYENNDVIMSGLKVGYVKDIQLLDGDILAIILVKSSVRISSNANFILKDSDKLGTKVVEIENTPDSHDCLSDGATVSGVYYSLTESNSHAAIDSFVQKIAKPILDTLGYEVTQKKR